ncbi:MAG: hypothetical protein WCS77_01440, partial [Elusimicrobiaceae bacterium]
DIAGPYRPFYWLNWLLLLLLLAAIAYAAYRIYKKRKTAGAFVKTDNRPLEIRINEEIDRLLKSGIWEEHRYKRFYDELSDIARKYLDERYGVNTHKLTTYDMLKLLSRRDIDKIVLTTARKFFTSCDMVKFAKHVPGESERDEDVSVLRAVIADTTPEQKTEPAEQPSETAPAYAAEGDFKDLSAALLQSKKPERSKNAGGGERQ